jgi:hypothetical protein
MPPFPYAHHARRLADPRQRDRFAHLALRRRYMDAEDLYRFVSHPTQRAWGLNR